VVVNSNAAAIDALRAGLVRMTSPPVLFGSSIRRGVRLGN